ncbi:S9 family peptidase [Ktedonosporobacter rubrisoli]|uniref:S9 family peptidase n=1 Tax=Ktedonosporobacter rubrisoli TaxID=2509675 RepID=A0A4V0YZL8_KTERU|nr:S9 family peptidase [Ktedonosporobacter rubrisoli]QBD80171.1 S9 family peptidase [Ktedonosporobacter rubrisoli]
MHDPQIAPYGSWKSPVTPELIVSDSIGLGQIALDGSQIYWIENRPAEAGRSAIVCRAADGTISDITPQPFSARTRVHEYGGGSFVVSEGVVYFANFADQRLYRVTAGADPEPITQESAMRYADMVVDSRRGRLICVREDHTNSQSEAVNALASVPLSGGSVGQVLVEGNDFYSSPRLSPDGSRLAWLTWNHPNMPWDGTELWVADLNVDGTLAHAEQVAGGKTESIFQPSWSPDGSLYFISDRTNWWNIYRWRNGQIEALHEQEAEFGVPQWIFGMSTYAFASAQSIICWYTAKGIEHLARLDTTNGQLTPIELPYSTFTNIQASNGYAVFEAASPAEDQTLLQLNLSANKAEVLRQASKVKVKQAYISEPQSIEFPTENGLSAYAYYYPPHNADYQAPEGELPPLLVLSHGGPTAQTVNAFNAGIQFWTSRGFAVIDVNYGGSTAYGRAYRERLRGQWGIVDVDDCVNAAKYLVERGLADGRRLAIRGGSAGGYTTLCALTFRDIFAAGASHFGVSDLMGLLRDTHKFESRYLDGMVGPYPEKADLYYQRSAINFTNKLSCPVIFFQGLEDKVVLPNQAERMVEALKAKKLPVAYVAYEGEQHGFRRAENIKRTLEAELYFYSRIFGFEPADQIEPVAIENL